MKFRVVQFFVQSQPKRLNLATILKGWFSPLELNLELVLTLLLFDVIKNSFKHTTIFFLEKDTQTKSMQENNLFNLS